MTRKLIAVAALVGLLTWSPAAFAMQCGTQGLTESTHEIFQHACYEYFFNNAGSTLTSGAVVIMDVSGTGVNATTNDSTRPSASRSQVDVAGGDGDVTNVGTYITTTTTADNELVAGVVDDDSCTDQTYCRVQVRGPRLVICQDATDAVGSGTSVSTSGVASQCGDAANDADGNLGVALEAGDGFDGDLIYVWIEIGRTD